MFKNNNISSNSASSNNNNSNSSNNSANNIGAIKSLTKEAKKSRVNRVYYKHNFTARPLSELGVLRSKEKSAFDLVVLSQNLNEQIRYHGFDKDGSYFELIINISGLYADVQKPHRESLLRHAQVKFVLDNKKQGLKYSYEHEDLLDYQKRRASMDHEATNVYRIGSLSIDISVAFALSRISFNGIIQQRDDQSMIRSIPARINISTHPSSDKFDYTHLFSSRFLTETISKSTNQLSDAKRLLQLALENRIDQPYMFRCELELLETGSRFRDLFWGAKSRRFVEPRLELSNKTLNQPLESLLLWSEMGSFVHLRRPVGHPNLLYGMAHCGFDYVSHLYGASCTVPDSAIETDFGRLASFSNIPPGTSMSLTVFKSKTLELTIPEGVNQGNGLDYPPFPVTIDGIPGWGLCRCDNPSELIRDVQSKLWVLDIQDRQLTYRLSSELLLGGKGSSLVGLSFLTDQRHQSGVDMRRVVDASPAGELSCKGVSVPRGVIVSSLAYQMWLESNPIIASSIRELDNVRRALSARSYYVNPLSEKHMTMAQQQAALRTQCHKTASILQSCPLPAALERQLYAQLKLVFGEQCLRSPESSSASDGSSNGKLFAIRSSATGEDSIETSAAGQMRTILDASGFESICRSIVACWASQFELEAVTYKTQNSSLFNWPMAVVVQELIQCDVAGVAATSNPIDGRAGQLEITANPGLGEGVVAGRKTDTVRVKLDEILKWDPKAESYLGSLSKSSLIEKNTSLVEKISTIDSEGKCCLSDDHIVGLSNLLIWLRGRYMAKEREIEWGITTSTTSDDSSLFEIHLLQSRPLTNLNRANNSIIAHELDTGFHSPFDCLTRANLGEVMPGCVSPLFVTHFLCPTMAFEPRKPYEKNHTLETYSNSTFGVISQVVSLTLTSDESCNRMGVIPPELQQTVQMMVGYSHNEDYSQDLVQSFRKLRLNPLYKNRHDKLTMFTSDLGLIDGQNLLIARTLNRTAFMDSQMSSNIDQIIDELDGDSEYATVKRSQFQAQQVSGTGHRSSSTSDLRRGSTTGSEMKISRLDLSKIFGANQNNQKSTSGVDSCVGSISRKAKIINHPLSLDAQQETNQQQYGYTSLALRREASDELSKRIRDATLSLYKRLITEVQHMDAAWRNHIRATMVSMMFNTMCIHLMQQQDYYKNIEDDEERKAKVMNDFSILIRGSNDKIRTESGDISIVLDRIVNCLASEGKVPEAQKMTSRDLYNCLNDLNNRSDSAVKFRKFMIQNGHRTFKEFDYANLTWADDPNYVIKSLSARLKQHKLSTPTSNKKQMDSLTGTKSDEFRDICSRITTKRTALITYAMPRAQKAVTRRENTKSTLIKTIDMYRKGFRALGALLCLDGRLSDVSLIYYLSLDELNTLVMTTDDRRADLPRLIYKSRRRQQILRVIEGVSLPNPTLNLMKLYSVIDDALDGKFSTDQENQTTKSAPSGSGDNQIQSSCIVRGTTSCNGIVRGRACVVNSLDEMDLVQPNDILITYSIDVSWTVYFFTIAGIVTEVGGIVSHGAVVAREYGIPTLCMAVGACTKFKTGQIITLDANKGICYLVEPEVEESEQKERNQGQNEIQEVQVSSINDKQDGVEEEIFVDAN